jgi:hypothetical protein
MTRGLFNGKHLQTMGQYIIHNYTYILYNFEFWKSGSECVQTCPNALPVQSLVFKVGCYRCHLQEDAVPNAGRATALAEELLKALQDGHDQSLQGAGGAADLEMCAEKPSYTLEIPRISRILICLNIE